MHDELPPPDKPWGFMFSILVIGGLAIAFAVMMRLMVTPTGSAQLGKPFPAIEVAGWINGPGPTAEELKGEIVVVDAWAFWCGPCRAVTPYIIDLHDRYKDRGVKFIGLTSEGTDEKSMALSQLFVDRLKIPWPNGYAAIKTLSELEVEAIPQLWIIDRDNKIVFHEVGFSGNSIQEMEKVLDGMLKPAS